MRLLALASALLFLVSCEHDEHPFEVVWSTSCSAEGVPPMVVVFDKDFWEDDRGKRREYVGEVGLNLAPELWDSWLWTVEVNMRDQTAQTLELVHVPIPDSFAAAYDLKTLELELDTFTEDPEGTWARMSGTCVWGDESGELNMSMADDCDACLDCSTIGLLPTGLVALFPVLFGLRRRQKGMRA